MAKDLTSALRDLTDRSQAVEQPPKPRGEAPAVKSAAVLTSGNTPSGAAGPFTAGGTKTVASSDGLFTLYWPESLKTTISGVEFTVGVIKQVPV